MQLASLRPFCRVLRASHKVLLHTSSNFFCFLEPVNCLRYKSFPLIFGQMSSPSENFSPFPSPLHNTGRYPSPPHSRSSYESDDSLRALELSEGLAPNTHPRRERSYSIAGFGFERDLLPLSASVSERDEVLISSNDKDISLMNGKPTSIYALLDCYGCSFEKALLWLWACR